MEHVFLYALSVLAVCAGSSRITLNAAFEKNADGQFIFQVD